MPTAIAPLSAADAPSLRALMLQAYAREPEAFTTTAEERAALPLSWWEARIGDARDTGWTVGAWQEAELLGAVALEFSHKTKTRHKAMVVGLYVRPEARGQGLARALMVALIEHAARRPGLLQLALTVTEGNDAALTLYRSLGFQVFGTEPGAVRTGNGFRAKIHLWRPLDTHADLDGVRAEASLPTT